MAEDDDLIADPSPQSAEDPSPADPGTLSWLLASDGDARFHWDPAPQAPPSAVGPYRIVSLLGEGGMGAVYLAEQDAPIRRRVAVKLIKAGMDNREVASRFASERQALALMSHPGIASVFDAGVTETGRPYFVMEYVEGGVPITGYCDERRLDVRARLRLFVEVCEAIQHAHHKAVIHRDIKPSNILVAEVDGAPAPKVIDFGIAKAMDTHSLERSFYTETGNIIGTPGYMSPEQTDTNPSTIDTRTDVYSLGALLYELLVGTLPISDETLRRGNLLDILLDIREKDPPRPSAYVQRLEGGAGGLAASRGTDARGLSSALRGDLDWIVMKALEKDPSRRYASPAELRDDIERFLEHRTVRARPPSLRYRMAKFARRNRWQVATAAAALALLLGSGVAAWVSRYVETEALLREGADLATSFREASDEEARGAWHAAQGKYREWQPVWERGEEIEAWRALLAARAEREELADLAQKRFEQARQSAAALTGQHVRATEALAGLRWERYQETLVEGDVRLGPDFFRGLVEALGDTSWSSRLGTPGRVTISCATQGADVYCFRYETVEAHEVPLAYRPGEGVVSRPILRVRRVRAGHETFRKGDRLVALERRGTPDVPGARADTLETRRALAAFLSSVATDEPVDVEVLRDGNRILVEWTPFPRGIEYGEYWRAGRMLDPWRQFGVVFEGYPLEFAPSCLLGRTASGGDGALTVELPEGSYLFVVRREGFVEARLPVRVTPGIESARRVRLPRVEDVPPDDFVWMSGGPAAYGGDDAAYDSLERGVEDVPELFVGRREVTLGEYLDFVNACLAVDGAELDRDSVRLHVPPRADWTAPGLDRLAPSAPVQVVPLYGAQPLYDLVGGVFALPDAMREWPLLGVSFHACVEYAHWRSESSGGRWTYRLPSELEWEKVARGDDRRRYVWGEYPLYSFCNSSKGLYRLPDTESDIMPGGLFSMDESVYGVFDLCGSMMEPVITPPGHRAVPRGDDVKLFTARGAHWQATHKMDFPAASRNRRRPDRPYGDVGLRLVAERRG